MNNFVNSKFILIFAVVNWIMKIFKRSSTPKETDWTGTSDIIFDLGGVLLDLNMQGIGQACRRLGIDPELFFVKTPLREKQEAGLSTVCQGVSASKAITDYQLGRMSSDAFVSLVLSHCDGNITQEMVVEAWNACIGEIPRQRLDMILDLRRRGFHTHLLSNTNDLHWEEIKRRYLSTEGYTCADLFDNIFVSHEMHLAKPDPEIYRQTVRQIGRPAEQCFFIDDTLINVTAARFEGLQGVWLDLRLESVLELIRRQFNDCTRA